MRKGITRKPQPDELATRGKNYIMPGGLQRLKDEHEFLLTRERPALTEVVAWAASNGDRSENASGPGNAEKGASRGEVDLDGNHISWVSPLGRALMKAEAGDTVVLQTPCGKNT